MGFFVFIKKVFSNEDKDEIELDAARARHGIVLDAKDKAEMNTPMSEEERMSHDYDPWEDLKHFRSTFFFGGWVSRKFHVVGEDKVKRDLEALAKKRQETSGKRDEVTKGKDWDLWEKDRKNKG
jgi:hypothetical protein